MALAAQQVTEMLQLAASPLILFLHKVPPVGRSGQRKASLIHLMDC